MTSRSAAKPDHGPITVPVDSAGFVRLYRRALDSPELAGDAVSLGLFVTLLLLVRWRRGSYKGECLIPGQVAITHRELSSLTGLSRKQIRMRLARWHEAGMIKANQKANRYHIITICNWSTYNSANRDEGPTQGPEKGQPRANRGPTDPLKVPSSEPSVMPNKGIMNNEQPPTAALPSSDHPPDPSAVAASGIDSVLGIIKDLHSKRFGEESGLGRLQITELRQGLEILSYSPAILEKAVRAAFSDSNAPRTPRFILERMIKKAGGLAHAMVGRASENGQVEAKPMDSVSSSDLGNAKENSNANPETDEEDYSPDPVALAGFLEMAAGKRLTSLVI